MSMFPMPGLFTVTDTSTFVCKVYVVFPSPRGRTSKMCLQSHVQPFSVSVSSKAGERRETTMQTAV